MKGLRFGTRKGENSLISLVESVSPILDSMFLILKVLTSSPILLRTATTPNHYRSSSVVRSSRRVERKLIKIEQLSPSSHRRRSTSSRPNHSRPMFNLLLPSLPEPRQLLTTHHAPPVARYLLPLELWFRSYRNGFETSQEGH